MNPENHPLQPIRLGELWKIYAGEVIRPNRRKWGAKIRRRVAQRAFRAGGWMVAAELYVIVRRAPDQASAAAELMNYLLDADIEDHKPTE